MSTDNATYTFRTTDQVVGYGILREMSRKFLAAQIRSAVAPWAEIQSGINLRKRRKPTIHVACRRGPPLPKKNSNTCKLYHSKYRAAGQDQTMKPDVYASEVRSEVEDMEYLRRQIDCTA